MPDARRVDGVSEITITACAEGIEWFAVKFGASAPARDVFGTLIKEKRCAWTEWLYGHLAASLPRRTIAALAARSARSVQHLWPEHGRIECEAAVAIAERYAAGEAVDPADAADAAARAAARAAAWQASVADLLAMLEQTSAAGEVAADA